jgi:hypothetical protein
MRRSLLAAVVAVAVVPLSGCGNATGPAAQPTVTVTQTTTAAQPTATVTATTTVTVTAKVTATAPPPASPTTAEPARHVLRGTLQLTVNRNPKYPNNCRGFDEEGYGDIHVGQQVVVSDSGGRTVATGELAGCKYWPLESSEQARGLRFTFAVPDVPETDFIAVAIGSGKRGQVTYSLRDLNKSGWRVSLNL